MSLPCVDRVELEERRARNECDAAEGHEDPEVGRYTDILREPES